MTSRRATLPASVYWMLALIAVLWGLSWPFMKLSLSGMEPLRYRTFSMFGASTGLFLIAWLSGARLRPPAGALPRMLVLAFFNMAGWSVLMIFGLQMLPAGRATILAYTFPLWTVPLSAWLMREPVTVRKLCGLGLGLGGMALLMLGVFAGEKSARLLSYLAIALFALAGAAELVLAADRSYMLIGQMDGDNKPPAAIILDEAHLSGRLPMSNGLSRLATRFLDDGEQLAASVVARGVSVLAYFFFAASIQAA